MMDNSCPGDVRENSQDAHGTSRAQAIVDGVRARIAKERHAEGEMLRQRFPEFARFVAGVREAFGPVKVKRIEVFETGEVIEPKRRGDTS